MRKCLAPFFIGRTEPGLDRGAVSFDITLPAELAAHEPGSLDAIIRINSAVRDVVSSHAEKSQKVLVLCGDCLVPIGCLAGLERCGIRPYLIWFDAHGDFHTYETTLSGHLGGMPLAMITGRGDQTLLQAIGLTALRDEDVCLIGGRDVESGERELLAASSILQANRLQDALKSIPRHRPVWIHLDTDYLSPIEAPAMRYPAPGGPPVGEVESELNTLVTEFDIAGVSISAWCPALDHDGRSAEACWRAVAALVDYSQ
jgi:arginase